MVLSRTEVRAATQRRITMTNPQLAPICRRQRKIEKELPLIGDK
jgi:hypothetical protein